MANGVEEIITTLYEMVQDAWSLPLGAEKCVVERDKVLDLLDEISNQLPGELKQAKTIVESRNEVITNAKREAENILKQAEQRAKQMVSREEVYRQAEQAGQRYDPRRAAEDQGAASGYERLCGRRDEAHGGFHCAVAVRPARVARQIPRTGQSAGGKAVAHHRGRLIAPSHTATG